MSGDFNLTTNDNNAEDDSKEDNIKNFTSFFRGGERSSLFEIRVLFNKSSYDKILYK